MTARTVAVLLPPDEEMGTALILAAVDVGAMALVDEILATYEPDEVNRILTAVRRRTRERLVIAGYVNPNGSGEGDWRWCR